MIETLFIGGPYDGTRRKIDSDVLLNARKREVYIDVLTAKTAKVGDQLKFADRAHYRVEWLQHGTNLLPVCVFHELTKPEAIDLLFTGYRKTGA